MSTCWQIIRWLIKLFKLNPMYYIVTGYRDSMLGHAGSGIIGDGPYTSGS
ncbi:MAG: hypothetical protein ACLVAT_10740 [Lachnospiraceae bacterium]